MEQSNLTTIVKDHPNLDSHGRPIKIPSVTVDALVVRAKSDGSGFDLLLITRGNDPHKGSLAFPGGFVDYNEDPEVAVLRELEEECGIKGQPNPKLVTVRGQPGRDPRTHIISIFYKVEVDPEAEVNAGDDAAKAEWFDLKQIWSDESIQLAFDHREVVKILVEKHFAQYFK